jgi:hypothetical protein
LVLRVFDFTGELKSDPDVQAIGLIRQLLGVVRKFRIGCGPVENMLALQDFMRTDLEVRLGTLDWDSFENFSEEEVHALSFTDDASSSESEKQGTLPTLEVSKLDYKHLDCIQKASDYITSCLGYYNPLTSKFRHGPGAVSDQKFGSHKYEFKNWPDRLDSVFPMADFACANYDNWLDSTLYKSDGHATQREYPAKIYAVPKTIKTPRLIAAEPTSLQWCQQNIRDFMYNGVRTSSIGQFIDFGRQELNGDLALQASQTGSHGTIDLSSASDRISCWHVERLFRLSPNLLNAMRASRSLWIEQDISERLPSHLLLKKYSTMGNATTFPVQSLFFLAVILGTISYNRDKRITTKFLADLAKEQVRVFGDDLIIPTDCAGSIVDALHALGLKVNLDKTFLTGRFRESCGVDAYAGQDVTTISVLDAPKQAKPGSIVSSVDVHNNLCTKGYYHTAAYIQNAVKREGIKLIPNVSHGSGSFGWYPNYITSEAPLKGKFCRNTQVWLTRCLHLVVKTSVSPSVGTAALLQYFTEVTEVVKSEFSSLHYHVRRAKSSLKLGWVVLR